MFKVLRTYKMGCANGHSLTFGQILSAKGKALSSPPVACLSCGTGLKVISTIDGERNLC